MLDRADAELDIMYEEFDSYNHVMGCEDIKRAVDMQRVLCCSEIVIVARVFIGKRNVNVELCLTNCEFLSWFIVVNMARCKV